MRVRHLKADDGHTHTLARDGTFNLFRHIARKNVDATQQALVQVEEIIDFRFRDNQGVAVGERLNIEKGEKLLVFGDAVARDITGDYFAEDGGHVARAN